MNYLVDTSVLTRLGVDAVRIALAQLTDECSLGRATITDLEIGFSARSAAEWDRLMGALSAFDRVEIEPRHFQRAAQLQRLLAERGLRGRKVPDLVIAAAAEAGGLAVLHYDTDFDHIAVVTGQQCQWIVPAGSIS